MKKELIKLIAKYHVEWEMHGMGAAISYSEVISDLEAICLRPDESGSVNLNNK